MTCDFNAVFVFEEIVLLWIYKKKHFGFKEFDKMSDDNCVFKENHQYSVEIVSNYQLINNNSRDFTNKCQKQKMCS